jgi:hypothetical protein
MSKGLIRKNLRSNICMLIVDTLIARAGVDNLLYTAKHRKKGVG